MNPRTPKFAAYYIKTPFRNANQTARSGACASARPTRMRRRSRNAFHASATKFLLACHASAIITGCGRRPLLRLRAAPHLSCDRRAHPLAREEGQADYRPGRAYTTPTRLGVPPPLTLHIGTLFPPPAPGRLVEVPLPVELQVRIIRNWVEYRFRHGYEWHNPEFPKNPGVVRRDHVAILVVLDPRTQDDVMVLVDERFRNIKLSRL